MDYLIQFHKICIFCSLLGIQLPLYSQQPAALQKSEYEIKGDSSFNNNNFTAATAFYSKAAQIYLEENRHEDYVRNLNYLSYIYYSVSKNIVLYNHNALLAFDAAEKHLAKSNDQYIWALQTKSTYFYALGDYKKSIDLSQKALETKSNAAHDELDLANLANGLGNRYKFLGDNENAIRYFQKAINLINEKAKSQKKLTKDITKQYLTTYENIAIYYQKINLIDSAFHYINLAKPYIEKTSDSNTKANHFLLSANIYSLKEDHAGATKELNKSEAHLGTNQYHKVGYLEGKANLSERKQEFPLAMKYLQAAHQLAESSNRKNTASLKSKRLMKLYEVSKKLPDNTLSLQYLKEGIKVNLINQNLTNDNEVFSADQFTNKLEVLFFCSEKAKFHLEIFNTTNKDTALLQAYKNYELAEDLISAIRKELSAKKSKTNLSQSTKEIIEGAINTAYLLYQTIGNDSYINKAFQFSEKNKALDLLEKISDERAKGYASIPDSLVIKENNLSLKISQLEKLLLEKDNLDTLPFLFTKELDELTIQKNQLINKLEREFPNYYNIKYNEKLISTKDIQSALTDNEAIIELFEGHESYYLFAISNKHKSIYPIQKNQKLKIRIDSLSLLISRPPTSKLALVEHKQYTQLAKYLYQKLLKAPLTALGPKINSLSIIADGDLNALPFEILIKSCNDKPSYNIAAIEYLFEDYAINYQYSLTHSSSLVNSAAIDFDTDFLGFAPTFDADSQSETRSCEEQQLENLLCSDQELLSIAPIFNHKIYIGKEATVENFNLSASDARIVHLATHTCLNTEHAILNKLYLSNGDFSILDLNNIEINAELAVLSACNSGIGAFVAGDGVQSLAWSFINGGCSSTLMSLWSIDDCATSAFMKIYYENLKAGLQKDLALRDAKVKYIQEAPKEKQHPFYWASFITYGNMQPIVFSNNILNIKNGIIFLLGSVLLLFLSRLYKRRDLEST